MTAGDISVPLIEEIDELSAVNTRGVMIDSFIVGFVLYEKMRWYCCQRKVMRWSVWYVPMKAHFLFCLKALFDGYT